MVTRSIETDYLVVGAGRDGHGVHRRADRPRRRARHARRPSPRGRRALARRVPVRPAAPGVGVLRRGVDRARHRRRAGSRARRPACRSGRVSPRSGRTTTTSSIAASSGPDGSRSSAGSEYRTDGASHLVTSLVSGETVQVDVRRRVVDATYLSPTIPATTPPPFGVADDVARRRRSTSSPGLAAAPSSYVIVGSGKTATDGIVWLLAQRRATRSHRVGAPARSVDAQPRGRPARPGGGARARGGHHGGGRRRPSRSTTCSCASRRPA